MNRLFLSNILLPNPSLSGESWLPLIMKTLRSIDVSSVRNRSSIDTESVLGDGVS